MLSGIIVSANAAEAAEPARGKKKEETKKTLRVLYWNIQNGMWAGQEDNYARFVEWVRQQEPDICIWCEAGSIYYTGTAQSQPEEERYLPAHWGELCARYGHDHWFMGAMRDNYPQVVTSRYPIDSIAVFTGEKPDSVVVHGAGWCQVHIDGVDVPLNIVTLHPKPFNYGYHAGYGLEGKAREDAIRESSAMYEGEKHRRKEVEYIINHTVRTVRNAADGLWIMAGDYNSRSRKDNFHYKWSEASLSFLVHDYMGSSATPYYDLVAEVYPGIFCPSSGKDSRIDYFYLTKPLLDACSKVKITTDSYTTRTMAFNADGKQLANFYYPSDHTPIIVDFKLSKLK